MKRNKEKGKKKGKKNKKKKKKKVDQVENCLNNLWGKRKCNSQCSKSPLFCQNFLLGPFSLHCQRTQ